MADARTFEKAFACLRGNRPAEAESLFREVLAANPRHFESLYYLAVLAYQSARPDEALSRIDAALAVKPNSADALGLRGVVLLTLGRGNDALKSMDGAVAGAPDVDAFHLNRGIVLNQLGRPADALASFERAVALNPNSAAAHGNRGVAFAKLGRYGEALDALNRAIALDPNFAEALGNRGAVFHDLKRYDEALADFGKAIERTPTNPVAYNNRAGTLNELRRFDAALADVERAIAINPRYADAFATRGLIHLALGRFDDAITSCDRALALNPALVAAHHCRAVALESQQRYAEAATAYERVLALAPDLKFVPGTSLYVDMHCCRWDGFDEKARDLLRRVSAGESVSGPYPLLAIASSPAQQKTAANAFFTARMPQGDGHHWAAPKAQRKIRLGYFSADFRSHATAYLMAGLMEHHDRARFEVTGFSFLPAAAGDAMGQRLDAAMDRLVDVTRKSDREVALLAREMGIDIAVDLLGFNSKNRMPIFAHRAAPVQVNYLGYPGTIHTSFDYIIADPVVITPQSESHFAEKVVYLPHSYQVNDAKRPISDRVFTRRELELPDTGFVFCCFNNNYKLTPDVFDVWMRLLQKVEGSVLWLLAGNDAATTNLRKEAETRGVAADRLVFARRMDLADHLARHRAADLIVDTFYYGAHTTASDALWAGVPVLTKAGETFASRVGASLLTAVGLPELITHTVADYEALALQLATQPERLADLKQRLAANRTASPLFDTARYTRYIESAYLQMWETYKAGLPPDHIHVTT